jgi:UDP-MurNAc hydroxylase
VLTLKPGIQHLGHAGFKVSGAHGDLLMDPWFNPVFLEAWFPWPDNSVLKEHAYGNWLYVSHHHEDHFDEKFLKNWEALPYARIIVPKFRSRRMERLWKKLGARNLYVLGHGEQLEIGTGVTVTMLLDPSHKEDSALLVDHQGYRFLNMNDCELSPGDIPQVDELAAQFSGALWYPQCYDYDLPVYKAKAQEVRHTSLHRMFRRFEASGATTYRPSAGPPAFLDPGLRNFNSGERYGEIFPMWPEVEREFLRKFPHAKIGEYLPVTESVGSYAKRRQGDWSKFYDRPNAPATFNEVAEHFQKLHQANRKLMTGYEKDVVFSSAHDEWNIRLGVLEADLEEDRFDPSYWIRVPRRVMRAILNGDCTWETALSSMRCQMHRNPDEYDYTLMSLLAYGDEPAITNEIVRAKQAPQEMIEVNGFEFQRYCPHAGEDLKGASIAVTGKLTCPRHGWCWDLNTGDCTDGDSRVRIQSRKLP